jgi:hypothetical protein
MKQDRLKWLKGFEKIAQKRLTSRIQMMRVTIRKKDWMTAFTMHAIDTGLFNDAVLPASILKYQDVMFSSLGKTVKAWQKKGARETWKITRVKVSKTEIEIRLRAVAAPIKKGTKIVQIRKRWYQNANNSLKLAIKNWAGTQASVLKKMVFEHGKTPDSEQLPTGQQRTDVSKSGIRNAEGDNLHTSLIQALQTTAKLSDHWLTFIVEQISDFLRTSYGSKVNKKTTKNSLVRNHIVNFTVRPAIMGSQHAQQQKEAFKDFKQNYLEGTEAQFKAYLKKQGMTKKKDLAAAVADSPDLFEEIEGLSEDLWLEEIEKAEKALRINRAKNAKTGIKVKSRMSFRKKYLDVKKRAKNGTEIKKALSKNPKVAVIATQTASLAKVKKSKRSDALRASGATMGEEGILIKEMLNSILPKAIEQNMGTPSLVNRTGRFKSTAEVTSVLRGPRGALYIDYAYNERPYGVFEPGHGKRPWANVYRDPRSIIGKSIREILATQSRTLGDVSRTATLSRKFK